jgi:hypothetical protein
MPEKETQSTPPTSTGSKSNSFFIKSPQSLNSFSSTAKSILDELREKHKALEQNGNKKLHPLEFISLDKIGELLNKYNNLSEQAKSTQAIDQAIAVILDTKGNGKEKYAYLYPYLMKSANKVTSKIAIISPQTSSNIDVSPYKDACFEFSKPMIDLILSNRSKKSKDLDDNNPGSSLFQKNKNGLDWLYPERFSLESEITLLVKSGFKPIAYIPINEFINDFIEYGKVRNNLETITNSYHIIIDELQVKEDGSYTKQPEMVNHYRAQADGLEKFSMIYLNKLCDEGASVYRSKIQEFKSTFIDGAESGRKQSREKIKALISLVKDFPFHLAKSDLSNSVRETCDESTKILESLMSKMEGLIDRKYKNIEDQIIKSINRKIIDHTKNNMTLMVLDIDREVNSSGIKEADKLIDIKSKVSKEILNNFGNRDSTDEEGKLITYVVDHSIMASVLHKYGMNNSLSAQEKAEFEIAKKINEDLVASKNRRLNINIKPDVVEKMNQELERKDSENGEKKNHFEFLNDLNPVAGIIAFMVVVLVSTVMFFLENDITLILMGFPAGIVLGFIAAKFIKPRGEKEEPTAKKQSGKTENPADAKTSQITKAASKIIYPSSFNSVTEKVYDKASLKKKIEANLLDIKGGAPLLKDETDPSKVASAIEHAILNNSVVIAIPDNLVPKNKSSQLIISKADFKTPTFRTQLSEVYRESMEKNKMNKELVGYFKYLINVLEVEYHKFLPKK